MADHYLPNELLSRLAGDRMYSVEFVANDHLLLRFDGPLDEGGPVTLTAYVWPVVDVAGRTWRESDLGYADAIRRLTPGTVLATAEETGHGIRVELDTGALVIDPRRDEVCVEIATIRGWADHAWMVWRPGEKSFEHLREG